MSVRYVVVIPVFKHSVLVADALRSVLVQEDAESMRAIVVDDGCPHTETREMLAAFQGAHPDRISVYRQKNRGLSGARNTGIEVALRNYPDAEGIYFLDADNTLEPWALTRVGQASREHADADWFFPDVACFGVRWFADYRGEYDVLEHLEHNYCEAGSFVRMRVFQAGLRFDESMKLGYEDWDFWLQCAAKGFRGRHLPDSGFRYRRRGESMLSDSDRDRPEILGYMRRKHRKDFLPKRMIELEARERPRSLFIDVESRRIALGVDCPKAPVGEAETIGLQELAERLADYPESRLAPQVFFGSEGIWSALAACRLLHWVLWECERLQSAAHLVALRLLPAAEPGRISISDEPFPPKEGQILYMSTRLLSDSAKDSTGSWIASLAKPHSEPTVRCLTLKVPYTSGTTGPVPSILHEVLSFIESVRQRCLTYGDSSSWRRVANLRLRECCLLTPAYDWHRLRHIFPRHGGEAKQVGFVLPIAEFGGVERVAHQTAVALRSSGLIPHLIIVGENEVALPAELRSAYETIRFYRQEQKGAFGWRDHQRYWGTALPDLEQDRVAELAGLCADLDVVINAHSGAINLALATLRRCGVITACSQHVFDISTMARPVGHPAIGLAFEHVYDAMLPVSRQMAAQLHALGVPHDKIIRVQNAGGFQIDDRDVEDAVRGRVGRAGPLRCLFMGRLDPQKGADRLERLIARTVSEGLELEWRIVGKAVFDHADNRPSFAGIPIEPAVFDGGEIAERLAWADVVVLPSRYEGLPLLVHEAMSFGVIVLAADVGAVSELLTDGETGFLVQQDGLEDAMVAILKRLEGRPDSLQAMAERAAAFARSSSWMQSVAPLVGWLRTKLEAQQTARKQ
jgi:glycosyltransferase involved in cell wall biosynthesis